MTVVSAPGKIILAGEHAVVYGEPALVAAVDRRLTVRIEKRKDDKVKILSSESSDQIKEAIKKFKEMHVVDSDRGIQHTCGFKISVESEIPVQVGMGSSAAVAVATLGALLAFSKKLKKFSDQDIELINKIAYAVEKKVHSNPSGVDNTIISFGGFLSFQREKPFQRIKLEIENLPRFVLVNTGQAEETTGEMVRSVNSKFEIRNLKLRRIFDQIEGETRGLLMGLKDKNERKIMKSIRECEQSLEELGVVGEFAKKVIRGIEDLGGAAKICGAGGIKDRSGILLCYHQSPEKIFALAERLSLEAFKARLGEEGVRVED